MAEELSEHIWYLLEARILKAIDGFLGNKTLDVIQVLDDNLPDKLSDMLEGVTEEGLCPLGSTFADAVANVLVYHCNMDFLLKRNLAASIAAARPCLWMMAVV